MDTTTPPRPGTADAPTASAATKLSFHPAFCQLGLPLTAGNGPWHRDVGTAAVSIVPAGAAAPLPYGTALRALLLHILDTAVRTEAPVVDLSAGAAAIAARFGLDASAEGQAELTTQLERLASSKITISHDGGPALSLFDGRAKAVVDDTGWRLSLKLNAKFFTAFAEKPIVLECSVVSALIKSPATLDVYMAVTFATSDLEPQQSAETSWDDLMARFDVPGQELDSFRPQVEESLRTISGLCPLYSLIVGDEGVKVRKLPPRPVVIRAPKQPSEPKPERVRPEPRHEPRAAPVPEPAPVPVPSPTPAPTPAPVAVPVYEAPEPEYAPRSSRWPEDMIALKSNLTGLQQVIWLQRANGRDDPLVEITPGGRYDPANVTVLALEPVVVQIVGGLYQRDFERVSAWTMANRDLIDAYWYEEIDDPEEILGLVKKVPAPGWRD